MKSPMYRCHPSNWQMQTPQQLLYDLADTQASAAGPGHHHTAIAVRVALHMKLPSRRIARLVQGLACSRQSGPPRDWQFSCKSHCKRLADVGPQTAAEQHIVLQQNRKGRQHDASALTPLPIPMKPCMGYLSRPLYVDLVLKNTYERPCCVGLGVPGCTYADANP